MSEPRKPAALAAAELEQAAAQKRAEENSMAYVRSWDRAMQRAFKGIISRPERHAMMHRATEPGDE